MNRSKIGGSSVLNSTRKVRTEPRSKSMAYVTDKKQSSGRIALSASECEKLSSIIREETRKMYEENDRSSEILPCSSCVFPDPVKFSTSFDCFGLCRRRSKTKRISEYWLISVPKEEDTFTKFNVETNKTGLSQNYKFHIPLLKVGKLDELLALSEQLNSLENYAKEITEKLCSYVKKELGTKRDSIEEFLQIRGNQPATFLTTFSWDRAKYPTWHKIPQIADRIYALVDNIQDRHQDKVSLLKQINRQIESYVNRKTDKLQRRYLGDIVRKEHFVLDSKFLTTLLVVVPRNKQKEWTTSYATMADMVVPNSSIKIFDDGFDTLYTLTLPVKCVDQFKNNAVAKGLVVREYKFSEETLKAENDRYERLALTKFHASADILRWTLIMFGECFDAWIHVKAMRIFVESVLRFGLPVNFQAMLILPLKSKKKLRDLLHKMYENVDSSLANGVFQDVPGTLTTYGVEDYYPYVYYSVKLDFLYNGK